MHLLPSSGNVDDDPGCGADDDPFEGDDSSQVCVRCIFYFSASTSSQKSTLQTDMTMVTIAVMLGGTDDNDEVIIICITFCQILQ